MFGFKEPTIIDGMEKTLEFLEKGIKSFQEFTQEQKEIYDKTQSQLMQTKEFMQEQKEKQEKFQTQLDQAKEFILEQREIQQRFQEQLSVVKEAILEQKEIQQKFQEQFFGIKDAILEQREIQQKFQEQLSDVKEAIVEQKEVHHRFQNQMLEEMLQTKESANKLGRTQYRSNTVIEADLQESKKKLQQLLVVMTEPKKETLLEIIAILDGMEEGIRSIRALDHPASLALANGFRIISDKGMDFLKKWDIKPIQSIGEKFNPNQHKALGIKYTSGEENIIVEEQRRGYFISSEVLRYAEVIVTKKE